MAEVKIKEIIRSRRRTMTMMVNPDATLTIKAPLFTPLPFINAFIAKNHGWIEKRIKELKSRPRVVKHHYTDGELFLYIGKLVPLNIGHFPLISISDSLNYPLSKYSKIKTKLPEWFKKQALEVITSRVDLYAKRMKLPYSSIKMTTATTRWGSCSHENNLRFNWKLVMTPLEIIDYVVVHELSHIVHKNHSQKFWIHVRNIVPDCKRRIKWLRDNGSRLSI